MKPTSRQLNYLRSLALKTGQTFTPPATSADASREIARLRATQTDPPSERRRERHALSTQLANGDGTHAPVQAHETTGYGANARWT
jgi:hypothetical protein